MQPLTTDESSSNVREVPIFQHFANKYKCCCSTVHVRHGAFIIGFISVFSWLSILTSGIPQTDNICFIFIEYFDFIVAIPSLVFFFIGLKNFRPAFLLPFIAYSVFGLFIFALLLCLSVYKIIDPSVSFGHYNETLAKVMHKEERKTIHAQYGVVLHHDYFVQRDNLVYSLFYIIYIAINSWMLHVVYKCYKYFKDLESHRNKLAVPDL